ncbi:DUF4235 domain-containing protein [Trueperella bialowiezensis]|uniref:DUF4235 domain-containing protein n=1 Tax=Trueperella bialowiezensis TaxID=312285 RepID=A0A448PF15_9ACTO|nr:DUF4235 domain-containing protein [Trueperella bialowiezensis]VEI13535.1 Uncharacterised protein [Trueperella bialowiezensis]
MNIGWKLMSAGISAAAGAAANAIASQVWEKGLHKQTPKDDDDMLDLPLKEVVLFTLVTTLVHTTITTFVKRKAANWYGAKA